MNKEKKLSKKVKSSDRLKKKKRGLLDTIIVVFLMIAYGILWVVEAIWTGIQNIFYFIKKNFFKIIVILIMIAALYMIWDFKKDTKDILEKQIELENRLSTKVREKESELSEKQAMIDEQTELINSLGQQINESSETISKLEKQVDTYKVSSRGGVTSRSSSSIESSTNTSVPSTSGEWVTFNVSAYCPCSQCCEGYSNGITASGEYAKAGYTIAAPSGYAFGTQIYLEGLGTYTVQDRGGAIKGNKIDVYMNSHSEALAFGRKQIRGYVVK